MANKSSEGFILVAKIYKSPNDTAFLFPEKRKTEGKSAIQLEGMAIKKQENTTTKTIVTRKFHANDLHAKLVHPKEGRMCATENHLHYIIKGTLEVCEYCATAKSNNQFLHNVMREPNFKAGKMICIDISSQTKPSYVWSKIWILIQHSGTKQKFLLHEYKGIFKNCGNHIRQTR